MGASPERKLVVKHTFLELIETPCLAEKRTRSFTDGQVFDDMMDMMMSSPIMRPSHKPVMAIPACEVDFAIPREAAAVEPKAIIGKPQALAAEMAAQTLRSQQDQAAWLMSALAASSMLIETRAQALAGGLPAQAQVAGPVALPFKQPPSQKCNNNQGAKISLANILCASEDAGTEKFTTVMLRNVPNVYNRGMLVDMLNSEGFAAKFDFLYCPIDFKTHVGLGYAFVNMTSAQEAQRMRQHFEGWSNWAVQSDKVCSVSWSRPQQQGFVTHIERYRNSPIMHDTVDDEWKPALFSQGERLPFPGPTKRLRMPRIRVL